MSVLNQVLVSNLFMNRVIYPAKNPIMNRILISVLVWNIGKLQEFHRIGFSKENFLMNRVLAFCAHLCVRNYHNFFSVQ